MDVNQAELEYRWLDAAKSYEQTLRSISGDVSFTAESWQRIGFCYSLASRQSKDTEDFGKLRQLAVEAYEKAAMLFGQDLSLKNQGKSAECIAIAEYTRSWLASSSSEKERMLDGCFAYGKKALEAFKKTGDALSYGKTCNSLSLCLFDRVCLASTLEEKSRIVREGIGNASDAISVLSKLDNKDELITAFSLGSLQSCYAANISE